jgi:hypothetical protein
MLSTFGWLLPFLECVVCALSWFFGDNMPPRRLPPVWVTPQWVPDPPANQSRYKRKSRSFMPVCLVGVCLESALPYWNLWLCTLGDGWYPFLGAHVIRFNRKKLRLALRLRRGDLKGVGFTCGVLSFYYGVLLQTWLLVWLCCFVIEHTVRGQLPENWEGFPGDW